MKKIILLYLLSAAALSADVYQIKLKGIKMGEIKTLKTLASSYLKAEASNFFTRMLLGEDNFVLYSGKKPNIRDAVFKEDKSLMLHTVKEAIDRRPKEHVQKEGSNREMKLECYGKQCHFIYTYKEMLRGKGYILFDNEDRFLIFKDTVSGVEISRI